MTQPLRDHGCGHPAKVHQRATGVPGIVQPDHRQPGCSGYPPELIAEPLRPIGAAQLVDDQVLA